MANKNQNNETPAPKRPGTTLLSEEQREKAIRRIAAIRVAEIPEDQLRAWAEDAMANGVVSLSALADRTLLEILTPILLAEQGV